MPNFNKKTKSIVRLPTLAPEDVTWQPVTKYSEDVPKITMSLLRQGRSKVQVAAYLGVSDTTLDNWAKTHPEFKEVLEVGKTMSVAWWQDLIQRGALGEIEMNPTLAIFSVCNQHKEYFTQRNNQDSVVINNNTLNLTQDQANQRLAYLLKKKQEEEE